MANAKEFADELQRMKAVNVIRDERVKEQFIYVYNSIWKEGGEQVYEREAIYFKQQLREKAGLRECSGLSVFYAFIDLAVKGLTLAPGTQALCYLIPRSAKVGVDQNGRDIYEKVCGLTVSAYGELVLRKSAGQIRHADNPVIVYEGDSFQYGEQNGQKTVNYMANFPRKSDRIVACFVKITRADGTTDYSVMTEADWMRLKRYSDRQNGYRDRNTGEWVTKGNELYVSNGGQIDTGFLMAKCVKHAFKTYPKLQIGRSMVLESEVVEQPQTQGQDQPFDPYAGVDAGQPDSRGREEDFAPQRDMSAGVTFNPAEQDGDDGAF